MEPRKSFSLRRSDSHPPDRFQPPEVVERRRDEKDSRGHPQLEVSQSSTINYLYAPSVPGTLTY